MELGRLGGRSVDEEAESRGEAVEHGPLPKRADLAGAEEPRHRHVPKCSLNSGGIVVGGVEEARAAPVAGAEDSGDQ